MDGRKGERRKESIECTLIFFSCQNTLNNYFVYMACTLY